MEKKELRVFHSDPLDYHSILDALKGCCALFYSFELPSDHPTYDVSSSPIFSPFHLIPLKIVEIETN